MDHAVPYLPIDPKGFRMAMGLRPLDLSKWLEVDEHRGDELAQKRQLIDEKYDVVVATRPGGYDASVELLDEVRRALATYHPELELEAARDEHPIVGASRLVQEDLCVLVRSDAWRLEAASVCFPSRWSLATKIGTTLDEIHRPIPFYDEQLAQPTNGVFDRMKPDRSFWRLNWTLIDNPALHQPSMVRRAGRADLDQWFFRVERQTLRQLPSTRAIVFTIHNYVASARVMCDAYEEFGELLVRALDATPDAMQEYKGWRGVADQIREALRER